MATPSSNSSCNSTAALQHIWEDEEGVVREVQQGEGGEQDPLMRPSSHSGNHQALVAVQEALRPSERLLAGRRSRRFRPSQNRHVGGQALEAREDLDQSGEN